MCAVQTCPYPCSHDDACNLNSHPKLVAAWVAAAAAVISGAAGTAEQARPAASNNNRVVPWRLMTLTGQRVAPRQRVDHRQGSWLDCSSRAGLFAQSRDPHPRHHAANR
jgi:hypothetical protein